VAIALREIEQEETGFTEDLLIMAFLLMRHGIVIGARLTDRVCGQC
jgi:hypothetical protein